MSHEVETMAWTNQVPWHGLGIEVGPDLTPREMQEVAGVDWGVEEIPTYFEYNGVNYPTGQKALVRDRDAKILSNVGENWHPVQNDEAFEFFTDFVNEGGMKMETAGSLKGGRIVWALAKVDDGFELFGGDKVESYLLFSNPHEYGKSVNIRFTPIRVVCNNTLTLSLSQKIDNAVSLNHRRAFDASTVKETMGLVTEKLSNYKTIAEVLGSQKASEDKLKEYFGTIFGKSNKNEGELSRTGNVAMNILDTQPGAQYAKGTWWQAYNAVTFLTDHVLGRETDTRLTSAWYGVNQKKKVDALELAHKMALAA